MTLILLVIATAFSSPCDLKINHKVETANCNSEASLVVAFSGGCPPYKLYLQDSLIKVTESVHEVFIPSINTGQYRLRIIDGNFCSAESNLTVEPAESLQLSAESTSSTGNDGIINLKIVGTPPYLIKWSDSSSRSRNRSKLAVATYTAIVEDKAGCSSTISVNVEATPPPEEEEEKNEDGILVDIPLEQISQTDDEPRPTANGQLMNKKKSRMRRPFRKTPQFTNKLGRIWKRFFKKKGRRSRRVKCPKF